MRNKSRRWKRQCESDKILEIYSGLAQWWSRPLLTARFEVRVLSPERSNKKSAALIAALYRMIHQGWTREEALRELHEGGFGFHPMWGNIPKYLEGVDLTDLQARVAG